MVIKGSTIAQSALAKRIFLRKETTDHHRWHIRWGYVKAIATLIQIVIKV